MQSSNSKRINSRLGRLRKGVHNYRGGIQIKISRAVVQRILQLLMPQTFLAPSVPQQEQAQLRPTLRPWIDVIDQILKDDVGIPRRYRTTAMRILRTLRDQHGFTGGYTVVQEYVRWARGEAGQSPNRRSQNACRKVPKAQSVVQESRMALLPNTPPPEQPEPSFRPLRLSLHPRRPSSSDEQVFEWMQSIVQGKMPLDSLAKELSEIPEQELKTLFAAVTKGQKSARNKALVVLAYARGINAAPICSFLQISTGSLFRYWRAFRRGGT